MGQCRGFFLPTAYYRWKSYANFKSAQVNQGLHGTYKDILTTYWQQIISHLETDTHDYKLHQLPLARIKKVMKADPEVKMISAEAPILFAKGCDIFITELTMRAWIHAEENKRRTLQRSDIASALAKSDMFDFLIDIVPREEAASAKRAQGVTAPAPPGAQLPPHNPTQHSHMPPPPPSFLDTSSQQPSHDLSHDYRQQPSMYSQSPQTASTPYGQQQNLYGEMDGIYGYGQQNVGVGGLPMHAQQVGTSSSNVASNQLSPQLDPQILTQYQKNMYQQQVPRPQDPSGQDVGGHGSYPRHDGGEGDADAEGERDYEVG